ncbi:hypothetical protein PDESU_06223 [Pontiella desulfatans]|uniref:Rubredoxin-like domain-containing protein n=1 Tax=Pontiella desulfatans TaxID=2750659 RepID=A0A6C2UBS6_PONDE|nr:hypothetical protein PDESU_06223 [Pontiella desulfatans]
MTEKQWVCSICGHVHKGEEPPKSCPLCHAPGSKYTSSTV